VFAVSDAISMAGYVVGPVLGGLFASLHPDAPAALAATMSLINFVGAWFFLHESHHVSRNDPQVRSQSPTRLPPELIWLLALRCLQSLVLSLYESAAPFCNRARFGLGNLRTPQSPLFHLHASTLALHSHDRSFFFFFFLRQQARRILGC
jgi:hypothetical protein